MILVDTSVWVDYLRGRTTPQVRSLKNLLSGDEIVFNVIVNVIPELRLYPAH